MKNSTPDISIIIATYNRAHLIEGIIKSICNQSFGNWECLIIDDGSTDNTKEVLKPYLQKEARLKYFERSQKHNKGLPGCRNSGLSLAKGDFIIFFDDDDFAHPECLEVCVDYLMDNNRDFCHYRKRSFTQELPAFCPIRKSEIKKFPIGVQQIEDVLTSKIPMASCTVMWRKECFEAIRFKEKLMYAEELECYSRILMAGFSGIGIDAVLYYNRKHAASNTGEFWNEDPARRQSKTVAIKSIINNLRQQDLLTRRLVRHFVQTGIFLKDPSIIEYVLDKSGAGVFEKWKYRWLYKYYPVIVLGHRTKKKIKKHEF